MNTLDESLDLALRKAAREMSEDDQINHIEVVVGNLSSKLQALASLCHQCTKLAEIQQADIVGLAFILEGLSKEASDCVTILRPGKAEDS